jgi:hypothetical protein
LKRNESNANGEKNKGESGEKGLLKNEIGRRNIFFPSIIFLSDEKDTVFFFLKDEFEISNHVFIIAMKK